MYEELHLTLPLSANSANRTHSLTVVWTRLKAVIEGEKKQGDRNQGAWFSGHSLQNSVISNIYNIAQVTEAKS